MNRSKRASGIYLPILFIAILVSCGLRTAAALTEFSFKTGYFDNKALIVSAGVITAVSAVTLFTYVFVAPKGRKLLASFSTPAMYIPSGIVSVALIFFAVAYYAQAKSILSSTPVSSDTSTVMLVPLSILALLSTAYFILNAMITERASIMRAGFGIFAILLMTLYAAFLYFDATLPLNAPNKIVDQMAYLFMAIFLLYEIRISLGRECWNLYTGFGFIAALLSAYSSVPSIVAYFVKGTTLSHSIYETTLTLCLCIFVICRIISAENLYEDKESELVTMIKASAAEREAVLEQRCEIEKEAYLEILNRMQDTEEQEEEPIESEIFDTEKTDTEAEEQCADEAAFNEASEETFTESDEIPDSQTSEAGREEETGDGTIEQLSVNEENEVGKEEIADSSDGKGQSEKTSEKG